MFMEIPPLLDLPLMPAKRYRERAHGEDPTNPHEGIAPRGISLDPNGVQVEVNIEAIRPGEKGDPAAHYHHDQYAILHFVLLVMVSSGLPGSPTSSF